MPRLPDIDSLGARPVPQVRFRAATVRNAGAVGDAVGGVGSALGNAGEQLFRQQEGEREKEDRLTYAAAKTAMLRADLNARQELQDDPDYETFEQRYQARMSAAREQAASLIKSKMDRRLFELDAGTDFERGRGEVLQLARSKRVAARLGTLSEGLDTLRSVGRDAPDDATRESTLNTAGEMIRGAIESGDIDPLKGADLRREWASEYSAGQISASIDAGDMDKARATFDKLKGFLSEDAFIRLNREIDNLGDDQVVMSAADAVMDTAPDPLDVSNASGGMIMPVNGTPTSGIGDARENGRKHAGVDLAVKFGTPVQASARGKVIRAWENKRGGKQMLVDYGDGVVMGYAHLSEFAAAEGSVVDAGQVIAKSGKDGDDREGHLHWTARVDGKTVDPRTVVLGGSVKGASGPRPQTLEEAIRRGREILGPNAPRSQVNALIGELSTRFRVAEEAERDREEAVVESVQAELVKNGGNWNALPRSVKSRLPAKYHDDMINFANNIRAPDPAKKTDPLEYVRLTELAATRPQEFAKINPVSYFNNFQQGDWEKLVGLRNEILGKDSPKPESVSISEIRSAASPALEAAGITTTGAKKDDRLRQAGRIYQFEKALAGDVEAWQRANPGRKPTPTDIQQMADRRLIMMTPADGGDPVPQFEARGPTRVRIPTADVQRITSVMTPILGRKPTQQEVAQAYLREARGGL